MAPDLINLLAVIILFGVFLWLVNRFVPMAPPVASLLNILVCIVLIIYILQFFHIIQTILPIMTLVKPAH